MRHITLKHSLVTFLIVCLAFLGYNRLSTSAFVDYNEPLETIKIQALNIPTEIQFAGRKYAVERDPDLIERMDKELLIQYLLAVQHHINAKKGP